MIEIIPSILTNDPEEAREMIARCEGVVDRISIDIIDGKFAGNKTINPGMLSDLDTGLKIDYHLMVAEPVNWVERCLRGQADRVIAQIEYMDDQLEFLAKVQGLGLGVGLALDLETPVEKINSAILTSLDIVLLMNVPAGFGGQKFIPSSIVKIKKLRAIYSGDIAVDGGVNDLVASDLISAGANILAAGSYIFGAKNIKLAIERLKYAK